MSTETANSTALCAPQGSPFSPVQHDHVLEHVERRLRESSYYYLRTISCTFEGGVLTLRGIVPSFYLKQTVQAIIDKVDGVDEVRNLVYVASPSGIS